MASCLPAACPVNQALMPAMKWNEKGQPEGPHMVKVNVARNAHVERYARKALMKPAREQRMLRR